ncbi:hypothetical protein [Burkholderia sp. Ac-20379]|uniref:hypothetical protein n=1 Tax=Burkholderia sp. Ac-20379 TaxID=2703900 RepID=UPI0019818F48|nr:hypothetical protein [Burkholderia sp. Ac-20379]MBN3728596.1 hypothetical protein [Burkholderia sp. Ac-20379]
MFHQGREAAVLNKRFPPGRQADKPKANRTRLFQCIRMKIRINISIRIRFAEPISYSYLNYRTRIGGESGMHSARLPAMDGSRFDSMTI